MIDKLDGRIVQTFIAVWEERSISRAAERLGYVQSTVTIQLRALEEAFGGKLFERLPRGVEPTAAGIKAAPFFYRFVQLGEVMQEAMNNSGEPDGEVRVRLLESFCVTHMPSFFHQFLQDNPRIKIRLETGFQQDIVQELLRHRVDCGIVPAQPDDDQLSYYPLVMDELVCAAPRRLADASSTDRTWLEREPVISFGGRCLYHTVAAQALARLGVGTANHLEFASLEMIKQMVAEGIGVAVLPVSAIRDEVERGDLCVLPLDRPYPLQHGLIVHRDRELGAAAVRFRDAVIAWFGRPQDARDDKRTE
ncbi:LysR family transcriptional regulator [Paenibacillus oenotherae]|uniref:LysR family transcriptional regulator n=1 Tax=Paenibacillus oenotherae TaxID=1435645 RepID=A0ABS7DAU1_9BACL|nr:LysR family transcriptional regulator [Paenibacillus oenotherae]MBW7476273.1 LysR family transcriptional regulator [Paenibacillus oenotherae]